MSKTYLCIDFNTNRNTVRNKTIFSNNLEDQFSNLVEFSDWDFEDFVRVHFLLRDKTLFASYPNFERETKEDKDHNLRYYNNVALRFPMKDGVNDLVLMGDIMEKQNLHRLFRVKAILSVSSGAVHYGELEFTSTTVLKIGDNWEEAGEDWEDSRPSWNHIDNSALTNDFMIRLNELFVVSDPLKFRDEIKDWSDYIESRKYLFKLEEEESISLSCIPEIFIAYYTPGKIDSELDGLVDHLNRNKDGFWTSNAIDESSMEAVLLHLYLDCPEKIYHSNMKTKLDDKKRFDSFTNSPLVLTIPKNIGNKELDESDTYNLRIRDGNLQPSVIETLEPLETLERLDKECTQKVSGMKEQRLNEYSRDVKSKLEGFRVNALPGLSKKHIDGEVAPTTNRLRKQYETLAEEERQTIIRERDQLNDSISKAESTLAELRADHSEKVHTLSESKDVLSEGGIKSLFGKKKNKTLEKTISTLESTIGSLEKTIKDVEGSLDELRSNLKKLDDDEASIHERFDPAPHIDAELERLQSVYEKNMLEVEEARIKDELRPEFDERIKRDERGIKNEFDELKKKAREDGNISRFHVFFELDVPDNVGAKEYIETLKKFSASGLKLRRDLRGDKVNISRQEKALENLLNGYVLNPFLATYLFSPKGNANHKPNAIDSFFLETLNTSQKEAVEKALSSNGLFLIQGPPGTGKTQVIAEIATQLAKSDRKVLIASQNNKAVDNAFSRIPKIPLIRPMRIMSEDTARKEAKEAGRNNRSNNSKKKNTKITPHPYSMSSLLSNFYGNMVQTLHSEVDKYKNRSKYESQLDEMIGDLESRIVTISNIESETQQVMSKIKDLEVALKTEYDERDRLENSNYAIDEKWESKQDECQRIKEFRDEAFLKKILRGLAELDFDPSSYGSPDVFLRSMYNTPYEAIVEEFSKLREHEEYFELKGMKDAANAPSDISKYNRLMKEYCEDNDFSESDEFPFFNGLNRVPEDRDLFLESKMKLDSLVEKKISAVTCSMDDLIGGKRDLSGINAEIKRLKADIERLKGDSSYVRLDEATRGFDSTVREIFHKLHINAIYSTRQDAVNELIREKRRISNEYSGNKVEAEQAINAYNRIANYLSQEDVISKDSDEYNPLLLKTVNVMGMTCSANAAFSDLSDRRVFLNELNIDVVIVDEVSKVPFAEVLHPILFGKTVILVGDHKQLPPMYTMRLDKDDERDYDPTFISAEKEAHYKNMYESSFFESLFNKAPDSMKTALTIQYRMHPDIMGVDNVFYNNALTFGGKESDKDHFLEVKGVSGKRIIGRDNHVLFVNVNGRHMQGSGRTSFFNPEEVRTVKRLLELIDQNCRLDRNGEKLKSEYNKRDDTRLSVGVITPYKDQKAEIRKGLRDFRAFNHGVDERFMVKSVDDFQGDERDIIILSMVKSKRSEFLRDYRRINVAISRARRLLIIVGNQRMLESLMVNLDGKEVPVYRNMIRAITRRNGLLEQSDIMGAKG